MHVLLYWYKKYISFFFMVKQYMCVFYVCNEGSDRKAMYVLLFKGEYPFMNVMLIAVKIRVYR